MPESTTRTGALLESVRSMPLFRQLVPMESLILWPVPSRQKAAWNGRPAVHVKLLLTGYRNGRRRGEPTSLFPPFAQLTVNWSTGSPVEFADLRYSRPWEVSVPVQPVGVHPHEAIAHLSVGDYVKERERLLTLYDELCESLLAGEPFAADAEFADVFGRLVEPSLLPYYRAIGPKFVERFVGPGDRA